MKYKMISEDTIKNLIDFLDEVQFDAAGDGDVDSMHKVNFCNWAIKELLNSYTVINASDLKKGMGGKKKPKKKTRTDYIDETFLDWNLPEMSDEEFEKLVDNFDNFLRAWEKEYMKKNSKKKQIKRNPRITPNILETMSLEEIEKELIDDGDLTAKEKFELYYDEHERVQAKKNSFTLDEISKKLGIGRYKPPSKNKKN